MMCIPSQENFLMELDTETEKGLEKVAMAPYNVKHYKKTF